MDMGLQHPEIFRAVFHPSTNRALHRLLTKKSLRNSAVSVWNGAWREGVTHGSKRCCGCGLYYRLDFVSEQGSPRNTLQDPRDDSIALITEYVGFRFAYLHQLWTRICRASVSAEAEAATITMVHPSAVIGKAKYNYWGTSRKVRDVKGFARISIHAFFVCLKLANKEYNFDVCDPVPDDDPRFGMPNTYLFYMQSMFCNDFILLI